MENTTSTGSAQVTAVTQRLLNNSQFVEAVFKGKRKGATELLWQEVTIRPVLLGERRMWQMVSFDGRQTHTHNYTQHQIKAQIQELLALPFKSAVVKGRDENLSIQFTKKGKAILHTHKNSTPIPLPILDHNRTKQYLLPEEPTPFLQEMGVMGENGRLYAKHRRKFRQINQFLQLIHDTDALNQLHNRPIHVVDFGCGNALMSFALYHYLQEIRGLPVRLTGVDLKQHLMDRHNQTAQALGWHAQFLTLPIETYQPETPIDIVISLHACDTATDDALAQAIKHQARCIFSAPCCHHHLQAQLDHIPNTFAPVARQGILKERLGDLLTDTFRAQLLMQQGYQTDVVEFIAGQETDKNLLIRAIHTDTPAPTTDYEALKQYWQVIPYLETLLTNLNE